MNKRESSESGDHHLDFASDIKALPPLYFDPSVGEKGGDSFGCNSNSGFPPATYSTLMCFKQTIVLSAFSGRVDSILPLSKHPKGEKNNSRFPG